MISIFFGNNANQIFSKSSVFIMHYPIGLQDEISFGKNIGISMDNVNIEHQCQTLPGSSGSPIMNMTNYKVIGVHKGAKEDKNWNLGTLIKLPIEKYNEEFYNKDNNKNDNNNNKEKKEKNEININNENNLIMEILKIIKIVKLLKIL